MAHKRLNAQCDWCAAFFSKYQCSKHLGECDCPKCQGICECGAQLQRSKIDPVKLKHAINAIEQLMADLGIPPLED